MPHRFNTVGDICAIECDILMLYNTSRIQNCLLAAVVKSTFSSLCCLGLNSDYHALAPDLGKLTSASKAQCL